MTAAKSNALVLVITTAVFLLSGGIYLYATMEDDAVVAAVKNSHVFKTSLKDDHISINSHAGVVALDGTVDEEFHRSLAEETVVNLPGVKRVVNRLKVDRAGAVNNSDALIAMRIKAVLLFHNNVSALKTKISVKDGVVTLQGEADSQAQKELTEAYADDIKGVTDVDNYMTVKRLDRKPVKTIYDIIDDASITSQIKTALLFHKSTSVFRTTVDTRDSIVTLTGKATNAAEKDLVTEIAREIEGVKKVINRMSID